MKNTINYLKMEGYLGQAPKIIKTKKSTFAELSLSTGRPVLNESTGTLDFITEWHKVMIFDSELVEQIKSRNLAKGDKFRVLHGALSYRMKEIKDANGNVITKVKEAFVVAYKAF